MAKPRKHRDGGRIRLTDEARKRRGAVNDDHKYAARELRQREHKVDEVKWGRRSPTPPDKTFGEL